MPQFEHRLLSSFICMPHRRHGFRYDLSMYLDLLLSGEHMTITSCKKFIRVVALYYYEGMRWKHYVIDAMRRGPQRILSASLPRHQNTDMMKKERKRSSEKAFLSSVLSALR